MSSELIIVLNKLCSKLGLAIDWTGENAVPLIQEFSMKYANYTFYEALLAIFACVAVMLVASFFIRLGIKIAKEPGNDYTDDLPMGLIGLSAAAILVAFIVIIINLDTIIVCCTFPEKLMIEYVMKMLK